MFKTYFSPSLITLLHWIPLAPYYFLTALMVASSLAAVSGSRPTLGRAAFLNSVSRLETRLRSCSWAARVTESWLLRSSLTWKICFNSITPEISYRFKFMHLHEDLRLLPHLSLHQNFGQLFGPCLGLA